MKYLIVILMSIFMINFSVSAMTQDSNEKINPDEISKLNALANK